MYICPNTHRSMNFRGIIPTKFSLGIFRGHFRQTSDPRKFISSEFRRKIPRDFRGKKKFRGIIFDGVFRRYVVGITLFRRNSDDFFPQYPCCFLVVIGGEAFGRTIDRSRDREIIDRFFKSGEDRRLPLSPSREFRERRRERERVVMRRNRVLPYTTLL